MAQPPSPSAPTPTPGPRGGPVLAVGAVAVVAQLVVAWFTTVLGLGWGGVLYVLAVAQAVVAFGVIAWLLRRRSVAALAVPVVSAALTASLWGMATLVVRATACSDEELALAAELDAPPGIDVDLKGEMGGSGIECVARFSTEGGAQDIAAHYLRQFAEHGWRVVTDEVGGGGDGVAGEKDGIVFSVVVWEAETQGAVFVFPMP